MRERESEGGREGGEREREREGGGVGRGGVRMKYLIISKMQFTLFIPECPFIAEWLPLVWTHDETSCAEGRRLCVGSCQPM